MAHKESVGPDEADAIGVWLAWLTKGGGSTLTSFEQNSILLPHQPAIYHRANLQLSLA